MAIIPKFSLTGDKELDKLLNQLGREAIKDAEIKRTLKRLAKPLVEKIKSITPYDSGELEESFGIIRGLRGKKGKPFVLIGPRYYAPYKGFHAHWQEYGAEKYNVSYGGAKMIFKGFQSWKGSGYEEMKRELVGMLEKKLQKIKKV